MRHAPGRIVMLLASVLASSACADLSDTGWVTKYASERLACDKEDIVVSSTEVNYYEVSGCGRSDEFMKACIAGACKLNTMEDLRTRAGFDLGCEDVQIAKLDRDTMGVTGCGQRATYKATLEGWIMNTSSKVDEAPSSEAPSSEAPSSEAPSSPAE